MGALAVIKDWLKQRVETPEDFLPLLALAETALRQHWLWPARRVVARLGSLERFAFWRMDQWDHFPPVKTARRSTLAALRELLAVRLHEPTNWDERRAINKLLSRVEFVLQTDYVYCYPWRAYLELSNQCNLRCEMCPQSILTFPRDMADRALVENARSLFPWLLELDLTGFGETLLNPMFPEVLASVGDHTHVHVISNGLLLTEEVAKVMVEHGLDELNISIDAATPETYKRQRHVEGFARIIGNLRRLVEIKRTSGSPVPYLSFCFTMMERNCRELPDVVRLAHDLGLQRVRANFLSVYRRELVSQSLFYHQSLANDVIDQARAVANALGIVLEVPEKFGACAGGPVPPPRDCAYPWEFIQFRAKGDAAVCCLSAAAFGDLRRQPAEEIWRSEEYAAFRRRVNSSTVAPLMCKTCSLGRHTSVDDPSMHFFVEQIDVLKNRGRTLEPEAVAV